MPKVTNRFAAPVRSQTFPASQYVSTPVAQMPVQQLQRAAQTAVREGHDQLPLRIRLVTRAARQARTKLPAASGGNGG